MGWWVMEHQREDQLAMPVRIDRLLLFGDDPAVGSQVDCQVRIREVGAREVRADLGLSMRGRVWARIEGWVDRRFDSDGPVWNVLRYPETSALSEARMDGTWVVTEHWRAAASRELMMRRYLGERERTAYEQLGPRRRRGWLLGRIALKDAVRRRLWQCGAGPIFPVEIEIANDASGRPTVSGPFRGPVSISVAHKDDIAVAIVGDGEALGIDIERVEPRTDNFVAIAFTAAELSLGADRPRDEWLAQLWTAKEAVAKARGTGLGDPRRFPVSNVDGETLTIDGLTVRTRREREHMVAWTRSERR
jgi:phosphopantetheinyl transferase